LCPPPMPHVLSADGLSLHASGVRRVFSRQPLRRRPVEIAFLAVRILGYLARLEEYEVAPTHGSGLEVLGLDIVEEALELVETLGGIRLGQDVRHAGVRHHLIGYPDARTDP